MRNHQSAHMCIITWMDGIGRILPLQRLSAQVLSHMANKIQLQPYEFFLTHPVPKHNTYDALGSNTSHRESQHVPYKTRGILVFLTLYTLPLYRRCK